MTGNDRISGDQGSIKPEETLTDIVRTVAYNRADSAQMRAAANGALIRWLLHMENSDSEDDQRIVEFALEQEGFGSVNEFAEAFFESGEPVMAPRKDLDEIDQIQIGDEATFELSDTEEPDGEGDPDGN